jgi:hypothetical protein
MRKFIALMENDKKQIVSQVNIFTKNHCLLRDVIDFYAENHDGIIGERNKFGGTLREIKEVSLDGDIIVMDDNNDNVNY